MKHSYMVTYFTNEFSEAVRAIHIEAETPIAAIKEVALAIHIETWKFVQWADEEDDEYCAWLYNPQYDEAGPGYERWTYDAHLYVGSEFDPIPETPEMMMQIKIDALEAAIIDHADWHKFGEGAVK